MYHIIVNPSSRSGHGRRIWDKIKYVLTEENIEYDVHFTQKHGDAGTFAKTLYDESHASGEHLQLIVLGGDGTFNEVIQGLPSFDNVSISSIPSGSSNDLARAIGISFTPEEAILHIINKPTILFMDMGTIHCENTLVRDGNMTIPDRRFVVSTGIGYDASICHEANTSIVKSFFNQIKLGKLSYLAICLKQLISVKPISAELTLDDDDTTTTIKNLIFIAGMNNLYEGGGFAFAPNAVNHDGLIDLCIISNLSKLKLLAYLPSALKGEHIKYPEVEIKRAYRYTVRTSSPVWVHTDGEVDTTADFIEVNCQKEAIKLVY